MKFRLERDVLADAVAWAARTLPSRPSMPMLAGLLIDAASGAASRCRASTTRSPAASRSPADVDEPGRVLVSGRLLADIARALPAAPGDGHLRGQPRRGALRPLLVHAADPAGRRLPVAAGHARIHRDDRPARLFAAAVAQVATAAGRDDTLPTLTGIRVEIADADDHAGRHRPLPPRGPRVPLEPRALRARHQRARPGAHARRDGEVARALRRRAPRAVGVGRRRRPHGLRG